MNLPLTMRRFLSVAFLVFIGSAITGVSRADSKSCNSACLSQTMQNYLEHMTRHDPAGLPLAANVNARQNAEPVQLGDGAWKSVSKIRAGDTFTDPSTGAVVWEGAVDTDGHLGSLFVRLKVEDRKITESEIFFNGGEPGSNFDPTGLLEPDILYDA